MNSSINPAMELTQRSYRVPMILALVLLLIMAAVWWSFFALRDDQSVRVLFSAGTFSHRDGEAPDPADLREAQGPAAGADKAAGSSLKTGADGFATVRLSDGSVVKLMPNTRLEIVDARVNARRDRFTTSLRLLSGEIETLVERGDGANREMNLFSNSVAIGVRGTIFSVIQDDEKARLMVTRGRVQAEGNVGESALVNANEGTVVASGAAVQNIVTLPPPPRPEGTARSEAEGVRFAWRSAIAQSAYLVEIAQDEAFTRLVARHTVSWEQGTLPPLERDGRYYWHVAGVDAQGLRGTYSDASALEQDYYLLRSRAALFQGDLSSVRANLALADKALDEDIDKIRARALEAITQQRFKEAVTDLEMVLALRDKDAPARNALANVQFQLLDYDTARQNFDKNTGLADIDAATMASAQTGIALIDVRQGQFDEALRRVREVLEKDATNLHALNVAAMASVGLGERDSAMRYLQQALALQPDDPTALNLRQSLQARPSNFPAADSVPPARGNGS